MALKHNSTLAEHEPPWSKVDKTKLPRNAHADEGKESEKSSWKYPHHWVKDGGDENDDGVFTSGEMFLHEGGLDAAWSAANGGRSGKEASAAVKEHLEKHRKAIGKDDEEKKDDKKSEAVIGPVESACATEIWALSPGKVPLLHSLPKAQLAAAGGFPHPGPALTEKTDDEDDLEQYEMMPNGTAVIRVTGVLVNQRPWWCDPQEMSEYDELDQALAAALEDPRSRRVLLSFDSPGGRATAELFELANSIAAAARGSKPVNAYVGTYCLSAAYLLASQCVNVSASASAQIGSIGCYLTLLDYSKMFEEMGVKVHVVSSGAHKGAGTPGAPITAGQLEPYQELVDGLSQLFQAAVSRGRNLSADSVKELASGRDWLAARARELKLCDFVESRGEMLARIGEYGPVPAMKR